MLDATSPARIGPGRFVLVNSTPGDVPIESLGTMDQPIVLDWVRTHPVMRFVDLSKVTVEEALRVRPLAAGKTLLESVGGPLIFLLEEPQRKAVFVGFDLFKTDLPLRVAFPLILANSLRWLQPVGLEGSDLMVAAGSPFLLAVEHGVQQGAVRDPSGATHKAEITRGALSFTQTDGVGLYTLTTGGKRRGAVRRQPARRRRVEHPAPAAAPGAPADGRRGRGELHVPARAVAVPARAGVADPGVRGLPLLAAADGGPAACGRRARRTAGRSGAAAVGLALLAWALTQPQFTRWVDRQNVFFLLDMSDSVSLAARETAYRVGFQRRSRA